MVFELVKLDERYFQLRLDRFEQRCLLVQLDFLVFEPSYCCVFGSEHLLHPLLVVIQFKLHLINISDVVSYINKFLSLFAFKQH